MALGSEGGSFFSVFPPSNFDPDLSTLQAGTYDSLAHLHFDPPPTPGSSGGPIIDEESGSVIGVMLGTQLVSQVEGTRGWGVPSEMIFEVSTHQWSLGRSLASGGSCADGPGCGCVDV